MLHDTFSRLAAHLICFWRGRSSADRRMDFRLSLRSTFSSSMENDASVRSNGERFRHVRSTRRNHNLRNATEEEEGLKNVARAKTPVIELASLGGGADGKRRDSPLEWTRATSRMQHQGASSNAPPLTPTSEPPIISGNTDSTSSTVYRVLTTVFGGTSGGGGGDTGTPDAAPQQQCCHGTSLPLAKQIVAAVLSRRSSSLTQRFQQQQSSSPPPAQHGVVRQVLATTEIVVEPPSPEQSSIDRCMADVAKSKAVGEQQIRWKYPISLQSNYSDNDEESV